MDDYKLMMLATLPTLLLLLVMRRPGAAPKAAKAEDGHAAVLD
jgi:DHA2 family multidrug resistance protein